MRTRGTIAILVLGALLAARAARAQSGACTPITSLPFTINAAGIEFAQSSTGKYRDNLTTNVTTPYTGAGTNAGNNN